MAVLAAGAGRRLGPGPPKALRLLGGRPLVVRALDAALRSGCTPVLVVTGSHAAQVAEVVADHAAHSIELVHARDWSEGIAASLRAALRAMEPREAVGALCVGLADQPLVGEAAHRRLASAYAAGAELAVATYDGRRRNPVLIGRRFWPEALSLRGDEGARVLLRRHRVTEVPCDGTGDPIDVDTTDDLRDLEERWRSTTASE